MKTFSEILQNAAKHVQEVDVFQLKELLENGHNFHLVDIREDREWVNGKIKTAVHLGRGIIERDKIGRASCRERV